MNEHIRRKRWLTCVASVSLMCLAQAHEHDEHAPHYDAPQHGGTVMEFAEKVHYEIVVLPAGTFQIWFSDARRRPLAAAEVSDVAAEIAHPDKSVEPIDMRISDDGSFWTGNIHAPSPSDTLRVGFVYHQESATGSITFANYLAAIKEHPEPQHAGAHK
jgi:hypothetical protein